MRLRTTRTIPHMICLWPSNSTGSCWLRIQTLHDLPIAIESFEAFDTLMVMGDPQRIELELQIAPDRAAAVAQGNLV